MFQLLINALIGKVGTRIKISDDSMVIRNRQEVADIIESFVQGSGRKWDWDDFCSHEIESRELDAIRLKCCELSSSHPPISKAQYCNEEGIEILRDMVRNLRNVPN
jgi:hypothetical protein